MFTTSVQAAWLASHIQLFTYSFITPWCQNTHLFCARMCKHITKTVASNLKSGYWVSPLTLTVNNIHTHWHFLSNSAVKHTASTANTRHSHVWLGLHMMPVQFNDTWNKRRSGEKLFYFIYFAGRSIKIQFFILSYEVFLDICWGLKRWLLTPRG